MTFVAVLFLIGASVFLVILPRTWAALPLLVGTCYMTLGQGIEVGPFRFTLIRLLLLVGVVRVLVRSERPVGGLIGMDRLMLAWAAWVVVSSAFHKNPGATLTFHLGMAYNALGVYFLIRCFCQNKEDGLRIIKMIAILLVPVAIEMIQEQLTRRNLFAALGGVPDAPAIRNGRLRSQGPFAHAILAGTVGAACLPLMMAIWREHRKVAFLGLGACLLIVVASASSGPLMSLLFGILALGLWKWRHLMPRLRVAGVLAYVMLALVMKAPVYYLIARIDLTGGSTGYHRARLMEAALENLGDWWLAGTDYTRHWMPYGVPWSPDHVDITNHYLAQGVKGGLPLMILFILTLWCGFKYVGNILRCDDNVAKDAKFVAWAIGASLFTHAASCISIAYHDQSIAFIYLDVAVLASIWASLRERSEVSEEASL